jgi:hypothetical protein
MLSVKLNVNLFSGYISDAFNIWMSAKDIPFDPDIGHHGHGLCPGTIAGSHVKNGP